MNASDSRPATAATRQRELELLFFAMFSAIPLYATETITPPWLIAFHAVMLAITARVFFGKGPEVISVRLMRVVAIAYVPFYVIDAAFISRSAIAASTHLILFVAAYQPVEPSAARNPAQRLLTASLIFTASVATSTHIAILPFVIVFGFLLLRQLIHLSHDETVTMMGKELPPLSANRAATFYVCGAIAIGIVLFPLLPRVRNPLLPGMSGPLDRAATGLSDTINLNEPRAIASDSTVVSRIWMGQEAIPFFTPLRLKGTIYERFTNNTWLQGRRDFQPIDSSDGTARVARPEGFTRRASVQQRFPLGSRLFLPVGTYEVSGAGQIAEGPTRDIFTVWQSHRDIITYDIAIARATSPRVRPRVAVSNYPVTPAIRTMAQQISGGETDPLRQAALIERYLAGRFQYVPDPASIGHSMTVDQFLLHEHRGHCEYFAAGMVALMTALNVPARIVGGFYGGTLNPLTGYFVIRREDAHAWVEVWDGQSWQTFDPTPTALRPGNTHEGLVRVYASAVSDWINYFWDRHILTFGLGDQIALAADLFDRTRTAWTAMKGSLHLVVRPPSARNYAVPIAAILIVVFGIAVIRRRKPVGVLLADHLRRRGIDVGPSMTMEEALGELRRGQPTAAAALAPLIVLYEEDRFSATTDRERRVRIRKGLAALARG